LCSPSARIAGVFDIRYFLAGGIEPITASAGISAADWWMAGI